MAALRKNVAEQKLGRPSANVKAPNAARAAPRGKKS
jgi:hypothetical protein